MTHARTALAIFVTFFLASAVRAADPAPFDDAVRALGRSWLERNDGVGLSIGIYDDGRRRYFNFGATRLDGNRAPTQSTVYEIGAIGKTMTAQLLARAVVEGRATLRDDVGKYLEGEYPNLENAGERVRLEHLVHMTSQLADNIPDLSQVRPVAGESMAVARMRVLGRYTRADFLAQLRRVAPQRPPGSDPTHSNVASVLLGIVLEKIYGEPFDTLLTREIEKPLRMASGTHPDTKLLATGYTREGQALPPFEAPMSWAATSLRYSAEDLLRFAMWQLVERDASVKLAHQPGWYTLDRRQSVAFNWIVAESPHGRRLNYTGGTYGFAGTCELYPDAKLAVVILSNKNVEGAQESLRALSENIALLARPVQPDAAEGISPPSSPSTGAPRPDR